MSEDGFAERTIKNASLLSYETGMRSAEIRYLRMEDIEMDRGTILIRNRDDHLTKNGYERRVQITHPVSLAIDAQLNNKLGHPNGRVKDSTLLFPNQAGNPYDVSKFSRLFEKQRENLLPNRSRLVFRSLRKSFGQNAFNHGVTIGEVSRYLGHQSVLIAEKHYANNRDFRKTKERYACMEEYLANRPSVIMTAKDLTDSGPPPAKGK